MNYPLPTYVPIIIGLLLGLIIFPMFGPDPNSPTKQEKIDILLSHTRPTTPPQDPKVELKDKLELNKLQMIANVADHELQIKNLQMKLETGEIENAINLARYSNRPINSL